jgi:hypothetical protein
VKRLKSEDMDFDSNMEHNFGEFKSGELNEKHAGGGGAVSPDDWSKDLPDAH